MKVLFVLFLIFAITAPVLGQSATITWTTTYQTIDGFGAGCFGITMCDNMSSGMAQQFFDPVNGIGLSLFRDQIETDTSSCSSTCTFPASVTLTQAIAYGVKVFGTPLSPPASMKSNGSTICNTGSGNGSLNTSSYAAFATYLKNYATQFKSTFGVSPAAISVQNEPNYCPTTYDGAVYTAAQLDTFIGSNLGPTLSGTGVPVMMPEDTNWTQLQPNADTCMTDSSCSQYVRYVATHDYLQQAGLPLSDIVAYSNQGSARLWMTETGNGNVAWDGTMTGGTGGLYWAQNIHDSLVNANANGWMFYRFVDTNSAATYGLYLTTTGTYSQTFWTMGNWSKFVRPGWVRIDATANPISGVYVTAFKDPSAGGFAIVAVNQNSSSANLSVSLAGFPSVTTVTPTLTSASANLVDQTNVDVSTDEFSYSLPANSVLTFHGTASSSSTKNVAAPTNLALTVH
jgi:glucuronoarabinoxylan endo-1,4-beta-xylanase